MRNNSAEPRLAAYKTGGFPLGVKLRRATSDVYVYIVL